MHSFPTVAKVLVGLSAFIIAAPPAACSPAGFDTLTTTTVVAPTTTESCPMLCADYINECGMWYGGCFPYCSGQPWPTFTKPPCPTTTTCAIMCVDYINECGQTYGGCFPSCTGQAMPTFTKPPCPPANVTPAPELQTTLTTATGTCNSICVDMINECGSTYGGCTTTCPGDPWPTFSKPPCPTTTA